MAKQRIVVSPEMLCLAGSGATGPDGWPDEPIMLRFHFVAAGSVVVDLIAKPDGRSGLAASLVLLAARAACSRLFPDAALRNGRWHLSGELRTVALAICTGSSSPADTALRQAKSIELFCGVLKGLSAGALVRADADGAIAEVDARRIIAARHLIDERWHEKLTLDAISRACGLNRAKLTRGFRQTFRCSVGDAIADRRLEGARRMLLTTDHSVASVAYACGYLSNASFTRAFSRRFGLAPTRLRQHRLAA